MKTMTCKQLGGACDVAFRAETFEAMATMSKQHAMEMMQKADQAHLQAMEKMKSLMSEPDAMATWFSGKRREFDALADDQ